MARMLNARDEDCGCRRCNTWAHIENFACGCTTVAIRNNRDRCAECTDFSGKRRYCGKSGPPSSH